MKSTSPLSSVLRLCEAIPCSPTQTKVPKKPACAAPPFALWSEQKETIWWIRQAYPQQWCNSQRSEAQRAHLHCWREDGLLVTRLKHHTRVHPPDSPALALLWTVLKSSSWASQLLGSIPLAVGTREHPVPAGLGKGLVPGPYCPINMASESTVLNLWVLYRWTRSPENV